MLAAPTPANELVRRSSEDSPKHDLLQGEPMLLYVQADGKVSSALLEAAWLKLWTRDGRNPSAKVLSIVVWEKIDWD